MAQSLPADTLSPVPPAPAYTHAQPRWTAISCYILSAPLHTFSLPGPFFRGASSSSLAILQDSSILLLWNFAYFSSRSALLFDMIVPHVWVCDTHISIN